MLRTAQHTPSCMNQDTDVSTGVQDMVLITYSYITKVEISATIVREVEESHIT